MELRKKIEALIFSAEEPVLVQDIVSFFSNQYGITYTSEEILSAIEQSMEYYEASHSPFYILHVGGGYLFKTKPDYHSLIASYLQRDSTRKLTQAALETLAIVAYRQPVPKSEIEDVRGVNSDYTVQRLMERDLVEIKGRGETIGKPLLYGTTSFFLDYFGINSLAELPKLREFKENENQIGEQEEITQEE